jgi:ADP-ribose pyrophosphatase YjhB (NUDIX family)
MRYALCDGISMTRVLVWLLLHEGDAMLLGLRKPDKPPFASQWVLPGDEMPEDESAVETLQRFGREQLDIRPGAEEFVDTLYVKEGPDDLAVNVFRLDSYEGRPRFRESGPYSEVRWVTRAEVTDEKTYPMPAPLRASLAPASERSSQ